MDGSRTHHGSQRDPTTDFEDREAHRDLTIPTVKNIHPARFCQLESLNKQGDCIKVIFKSKVGLGSIKRHKIYGKVE